jgi:GNAT superfamily N-acetyltransferase
VRAVLVEHAVPIDRDAVLELFEASVPVVFRDVVREPLLAAFGDTPDEERCLVARDRSGGAITGFALYGFVAGAAGAGRLRAAGVAPMARRRGVGLALVENVVAELRDDGARFVIAELADAPEMRFVSVLLDACGFAEEARAADLVREGVAMRYLVRRLAGPGRPA